MKVKLTFIYLFATLSLPCLGQIPILEVVKPAFLRQADEVKPNYSSVSVKHKPTTDQWRLKNPQYILHPDAGYIPKEQPQGNVIEILERRTETTRFYVDADTPGKVFSQGSSGPIHYKKNGQWLIIDERLGNKGDGLLEASRQPEPVGFDLKTKRSYIQTEDGPVFFNDWKLLGMSGKKMSVLAEANWANYSFGDDGLFVTDIFPGVDAQMHVMKGRIKTNLVIRNWKFSGYTGYIFSDSFQTSKMGSFSFVNGLPNHSGSAEADFKVSGKLMARVGGMVVYPENEPQYITYLPYSFKDNTLAATIDAKKLEDLLKMGNVVIDPLVTGPRGVHEPPNVMNSYNDPTCSYGFNNNCSYSWTVPVPPYVTVTNVNFINMISTLAPCTRDKMRFRYGFGDQLCGKESEWWAIGLPASPGTSGGNLSSSTYYNNCIKSGCELTNVKVTMSILRGCMGPSGCESSCVQGIGPFITTIEGRTIEIISVAATPNASSCPGEAMTLSAIADFGVKPHSFVWTPGNASGNTLVVKPMASTTYTVDVKDACNQTVSGSVLVSVPPLPPAMTAGISASGTAVCEGTEVVFTSSVKNALNPAYQWKINGVDVVGGTIETFRSASLKNNDVVSLQVTNAAACAIPRTVKDSIRIRVLAVKPYDEPMTLTACDSIVFEGRTIRSDTTIRQTIRSSFGCDSINRTIQITVKSWLMTLEADYGSSKYRGDPVVLTSSGSEPFSVTGWSPPRYFGDQHAITQSIKIPESDVTLFVFGLNQAGCVASASIVLKGIPKPFGNLLPTAFTPNGDGLNDYWDPVKKSAFPLGELFVYNRWGQCIFHTTDYTVPWDGQYAGQKVPIGVYPYRLIIDKRFEFKGTVTVLY